MEVAADIAPAPLTPSQETVLALIDPSEVREGDQWNLVPTSVPVGVILRRDRISNVEFPEEQEPEPTPEPDVEPDFFEGTP